jgi:hypothetical protein
MDIIEHNENMRLYKSNKNKNKNKNQITSITWIKKINECLELCAKKNNYVIQNNCTANCYGNHTKLNKYFE